MFGKSNATHCRTIRHCAMPQPNTHLCNGGRRIPHPLADRHIRRSAPSTAMLLIRSPQLHKDAQTAKPPSSNKRRQTGTFHLSSTLRASTNTLALSLSTKQALPPAKIRNPVLLCTIPRQIRLELALHSHTTVSLHISPPKHHCVTHLV